MGIFDKKKKQAAEGDPELAPDAAPEDAGDRETTPALGEDAPPPRTRSAAKREAGARAPYEVWAHGPLQHDGKTYGPGATVLLTDEQAEAIGPTVSEKKKAEPEE